MSAEAVEHHPHLRCRLHMHKWAYECDPEGHHHHTCEWCHEQHDHTDECGPLGVIGGC